MPGLNFTVNRLRIDPSKLDQFLTLSFTDMVKAGNYDYVVPFLTEANFPLHKTIETTLHEFDLGVADSNRPFTFREGMERLGKSSLPGGYIEHLWAVGALQPYFQTQHNLVAPASIWHMPGEGVYSDAHFVPHLRAFAHQRQAYTREISLGWDHRWSVLVLLPRS